MNATALFLLFRPAIEQTFVCTFLVLLTEILYIYIAMFITCMICFITCIINLFTVLLVAHSLTPNLTLGMLFSSSYLPLSSMTKSDKT